MFCVDSKPCSRLEGESMARSGPYCKCGHLAWLPRSGAGDLPRDMLMLVQMRRAVTTIPVALGAVPKLHMGRIIARNSTRAANMHDPPWPLHGSRLEPGPAMALPAV